MKQIFLSILSVLILFSCASEKKQTESKKPHNSIRKIGAMKEVMWKGELFGKIHLDTITPKLGLYGLGPLSYLTGEILINNGRAFVSRVVSDSSMSVEETYDISAPFFVFSNVTDWDEIVLDQSVKDIKSLEAFIIEKTADKNFPFTFKLAGTVSSASIHIQNLPEGTVVSSPQEAHQGQQSYSLENEEVEIVGFFSREDQGVFTHHDTFIHMHLITKDENQMGHLDRAVFDKMLLYLPAND